MTKRITKSCGKMMLALLFLLVAGTTSSLASTLWVRNSNNNISYSDWESKTPYVKIGTSSYTKMKLADTKGWYWLDVTSGTTATFATSSSGSNASPAVTFSSSADSYFTYDCGGYAINFTSVRSASYWTLIEILKSGYGTASAVIKMNGISLTKVGGSSTVDVYAWTGTSNPGDMYIQRRDPNNVNTIWNMAKVSYNRGYYYSENSSGDWGNSTTASTNRFNSSASGELSATTPKKPEVHLMHWTSSLSSTSGHVQLSTTDYETFTGTVNLSAGEYFIFGLSHLTSWTDGRLCPTSDTSTLPTTNLTATLNGNGAYKANSGGMWNITYTWSTNKWSATKASTETGKMYIIGAANGNSWDANVGVYMEKTADGIYQADNVTLLAGAEFGFSAKLGSSASDTSTRDAYRYYSTGSGTYLVTDAMVGILQGSNTRTAQEIDISDSGSQNYKMQSTGTYRVIVNTNTGKVTFSRNYMQFYMLGKGMTHGSTTISDWAANSGFEMTTTDGVTYTLTNVNFTSSGAFSFAETLGANSGDWNNVTGRYASKSTTDGTHYVLSNKTKEINVALPLGDRDGAVDQAFYFSSTTSGKYNVIVKMQNGVAKTVTLKENVSTAEEIIIRLEKKGKVANVSDKPSLRVYNREDNDKTRYQGPWAESGDNSTSNGKVSNATGNGINDYNTWYLDGNMGFDCSSYTTADGREWYQWRVYGDQFRIGELYFYRNSNYSDSPTDCPLIRQAGTVYYTWEDNNTITDYTEYYYTDHVDEAPSTATMLDGHYYVYFVNTPGWENVYCHAWDAVHKTNGQNTALLPKGSNAAWPGDKCTFVGYNEDGYEVYRYDFGLISDWAGVTISGVIFNGGLVGGVVEEQTKDFVFENGASYDYVAMISLGRALGNIIKNGFVNGPRYIVQDDMVIVYYDPDEVTTVTIEGETKTYTGAFYAKDLGKANIKSVNTSAKTDYVFDITQFDCPMDYPVGVSTPLYKKGDKVQLLMKGRNSYDQSNWVKVVKGTSYDGISWEKTKLEGKIIPGETFHGQLINNYNPTMICEQMPSSLSAKLYDLNEYIAAHFNDDYSVFDMGPMFFVQPKPQEVAHVTWAVYAAGDNATWALFYVPKTMTSFNSDPIFNHGNAYDLTGGFYVDFSKLRSGNDVLSSLKVGQAYQFDAIVRYRDDENAADKLNATVTPAPAYGAPRRANQPHDNIEWNNWDGLDNSQYIVYPISIDASNYIVTGVDDVKVDDMAVKEVKTVNVYNAMGQTLAEPQRGLNIIETIFTDGTRMVSKVMR